MWLCKTKQAPRGVIYWLPTKGLMNDFVDTKVEPLLQENDELLLNSTHKDQAQNKGLKYIYGVPTFWRGIESKSGVKSISGDADIFDEYDEADPSQIKQAEQRTSASLVKLRRRLSVPTIPDFGINKEFQTTDQCAFALKCGSCGSHTILEETFPQCLKQDKSGHYYRACRKCAAHLDITVGQWVRQNTSSRRGYQISQLYSPFITPDEIMHEYETTEFLSHFYNHVLGLPYLAATDRVTESQVLSLCDNNQPMKSESVSTTVMGIDQGSKLHCVILVPGERPRVVWVGELKEFEEVDQFIKKFNVRDLVIDGLPETRKARELLGRHPYKVWLNYYNEHQKGSYAWKEDERIVSVNRTESLDVGTLALLRGTLMLPRREPEIEKFALHCSKIAKVVEEDKETGSKKYVYRKLGPDHYRHALNYALIASSRQKFGRPISVFR